MARLVTSPNRAYREAVQGLAKRLRMPARVAGALRFYAYQHPIAPSLISLRWAKGKLGVRAAICRVEALTDIPTELTCVAQCEVQGNVYLFAVDKITEEKVYVYDRSRKQRGGVYSLSLADFAQKYSGFLLVVEGETKATIDVKEPLLKGHVRSTRYARMLQASILAALVGLAAMTFVQYGSAVLLLLQILLIIGGLLSWLLLRRYNGIEDAIAQRICSIGGANFGCPTRSSLRLPLGLGLPEIALMYFAALFMLSLLSIPPMLLAVGSTIGTLFIPFSIFYQYSKKCQWCLLCLAVDVTLGLMGALGALILSSEEPYQAHHGVCLPILAAVGMGVTVALCSKKYAEVFGRCTIAHRQFALSKYKAVAGAPSFNFPTISMPTQADAIFNPCVDGVHTVVMVIALDCPACHEFSTYFGHAFMRKRDVTLAVVLSTKEYGNDLNAHAAGFLRQCDADGLLSALQRPNTKKRNVAASHKELYRLARHQQWCIANSILATPTLCVDGKLLPPVYSPEDIDYICV